MRAAPPRLWLLSYCCFTGGKRCPIGGSREPEWVVSMPSAESGCQLCLPTATKLLTRPQPYPPEVLPFSLGNPRSEVVASHSVIERKSTRISGPGLGEARLPRWVCEEFSAKAHVYLGHQCSSVRGVVQEGAVRASEQTHPTFVHPGGEACVPGKVLLPLRGCPDVCFKPWTQAPPGGTTL